jgi:hypothetical protein
MPQVILVRLVPMKPTSGASFSSYLTNLSIAAHEVSFADPARSGPAFGMAIPGVEWLLDWRDGKRNVPKNGLHYLLRKGEPVYTRLSFRSGSA